MHGYIQALTESKATDHDATIIMAIKTSFPQTLQNRLTKNLGVLSASAVSPTTNDKKLKGGGNHGLKYAGGRYCLV
jgi:hypothetical protein